MQPESAQSPGWLVTGSTELNSGQQNKASHILRAIGEDGKSLRKAAEEIGVAPSTFLLWCSKDADLAEQYARAREERGFVLAEQTIEIADDGDLDPADKRVRIDARKWFASKLNPKNLGDKVDLNHGGSVGVNITRIENVVVDPTLSEQEK